MSLFLFVWLDNLLGEAIVYHQLGCQMFCQLLAMGCPLLLLWVELHKWVLVEPDGWVGLLRWLA